MPGEIAVMCVCRTTIGGVSVLWSIEIPKMPLFAIYADVGLVFPVVRTETDALQPRRASLRRRRIPCVFGDAALAQIGATIIKAVPVDVIDMNRAVRQSKDKPVHFDRGSIAPLADVLSGVSARIHIPAGRPYALKVSVVDEYRLPGLGFKLCHAAILLLPGDAHARRDLCGTVLAGAADWNRLVGLDGKPGDLP